ncbi:unnamed protein product [Psylliodes chrysocephalus]|uniref:Uncharacterized protein n=1 Tax=Psylliodes chrysocephalus TaxID=3402493 RepID=A0A9P0GGU9_9CUCU|nr:unnamed protein product [Psylliodes chrysocephala]
MYNIKGPSKFVAKTTRRGLQQNIDNLRDFNKNKTIENEDNDYKNGPKPVFLKKSSPTSPKHKAITPQHEEIINFIHDSWNSVCSEFDQESTECNEGEQTVCYYEEEPCISLQDFKPFDLESWWGKRLYAYVTNSANQKS